eukprot:Rhum_TRINITY_DN6356_c0_g1::Rhum_TRINITY_DN6356_c0_g1_i1::g.19813::m.19813
MLTTSVMLDGAPPLSSASTAAGTSSTASLSLSASASVSEERPHVLHGVDVPRSAVWDGAVRPVPPQDVDPDVARLLCTVSPYGALSATGCYEGGRDEVDPISQAQYADDKLHAAQRLPPLPWAGVGTPGHLPSGEESGCLYNVDHYPSASGARVREAVEGCEAANGPPAPVTPRKGPHTRYLSLQDGEHPLWYKTVEGRPLSSVEVEVRWGGPLAMEVTAVALAAKDLRNVAYLGRVSVVRRWFLSQSRACVLAHCLFNADATGGYATVALQLSELPPQCTSVYFVATGGKFHMTDSLVVSVSSRRSPHAADLDCQYVLDMTPQVKGSRAQGLVLARMVRRPHAWTLSGVGVEAPTEASYDEILPYLYSDCAVARPAPPDLVTRVAAGVRPEHFEACRTLRFPGRLTAARLAELFNKHGGAKGASEGAITLGQYTAVLEDLLWDGCSAPVPGEVLKRQTEAMLKEQGFPRGQPIDVRRFTLLFKRTELYRTACRKAGIDPDADVVKKELARFREPAKVGGSVAAPLTDM